MPRNIYLAAAYEKYEELQLIAKRLESFGHTITSRWISGKEASLDVLITDGTINGDVAAELAFKDMEDISFSDTFVMLAGGGRGGRHWEAGFAYYLCAETIIVGGREHLFHYLPNVKMFRTVEQAMEYLGT